MTTYSTTCYTEESCSLECPDVNIPDKDTPNITSNGIMWHKVKKHSFIFRVDLWNEIRKFFTVLNLKKMLYLSITQKGESELNTGYFPSVEEDDHGVYTCTRSYLYDDKVYNMTFSVILDVQPSSKWSLFLVLFFFSDRNTFSFVCYMFALIFAVITGTAEILSPHNQDVISVALGKFLMLLWWYINKHVLD